MFPIMAFTFSMSTNSNNPYVGVNSKLAEQANVIFLLSRERIAVISIARIVRVRWERVLIAWLGFIIPR